MYAKVHDTPSQVPNMTQIRTTLLVVPRSGSNDHEIPVASPASLSSSLTLLSLCQCLCLGRHPRRNYKPPLGPHSSPFNPFCHTVLLCKHFVLTSTSPLQLVTVIQLPSLTIYQSRELFEAAPGGVVNMCQTWIHSTSPLILAWSSCAHTNSFFWSLNPEPPGGTGCPLPSSFHHTKWEGSPTEMLVQWLA